MNNCWGWTGRRWATITASECGRSRRVTIREINCMVVRGYWRLRPSVGDLLKSVVVVFGIIIGLCTNPAKPVKKGFVVPLYYDDYWSKLVCVLFCSFSYFRPSKESQCFCLGIYSFIYSSTINCLYCNALYIFAFILMLLFIDNVPQQKWIRMCLSRSMPKCVPTGRLTILGLVYPVCAACPYHPLSSLVISRPRAGILICRVMVSVTIFISDPV